MRIRYYPLARPGEPRPPLRTVEVTGGAFGCFIAMLVVAGLLLTTCVSSIVALNDPSNPSSPNYVLPTPGLVDGPQPPQVEACSYPPAVYDGMSCFPGGEPIKVTRVIDGDTVELADRRIVRLLGVDAPEANSCAGPGATSFTRGLVEGKWALMYREPGVTVDKYDRELAYLQAPVDVHGIYHPAMYGDDIGYELTLNGWAEPFSNSDANATYDKNIQSAYETSTHQSDGMFAPPCGTPEPYDVPNYDYPNPSPGDGDDGENRLCRGKWYC